MSVLKEMEALAATLRDLGLLATTPVKEEESHDWNKLPLEAAVALKRPFLSGYFETIRTADAVLIANYAKHGIPGYVGANALMEAACAHAHGKPVFFLQAVGPQPCQLEALAVSAGILDGDLAPLVRALMPSPDAPQVV